MLTLLRQWDSPVLELPPMELQIGQRQKAAAHLLVQAVPPPLPIGLGIKIGSANNPININATTIPAIMGICLLPLFIVVVFFLLMWPSFRHAGVASLCVRILLLQLQAR
jgi:hypothetical protein